MPLESAQLLCSPFETGTAPYKRAYYKHPCSIWTRTSKANYEWLLAHAFALSDEYTRRYGKVHASRAVMVWCRKNYAELLEFPENGLTDFAQAMPEEYRHSDSVEAYRRYYNGEKSHLFEWTNRTPPRFAKICK